MKWRAGHASAELFPGSDVEPVGVAINDLLTPKCGQCVGKKPDKGRRYWIEPLDLLFYLWSLGDSNP